MPRPTWNSLLFPDPASPLFRATTSEKDANKLERNRNWPEVGGLELEDKYRLRNSVGSLGPKDDTWVVPIVYRGMLTANVLVSLWIDLRTLAEAKFWKLEGDNILCILNDANARILLSRTKHCLEDVGNYLTDLNKFFMDNPIISISV